jgi:hypothetical protein
MVESLEKGIRMPYHKKHRAMPYLTLRKNVPAECKEQRERANISIEELERMPRPDYELAGNQ